MIYCLIKIKQLVKWKIKYPFKLKLSNDIIRVNNKLKIVRDYMFEYPTHIVHVTSEEFMAELEKRIDEIED